MEYNQINLFDSNTDYYDEIDSSLDLNNLNFKVHASIIYKLGESLIADEVTALSELIKNAYDADASFCSLSIFPDYINDDGTIGKIEISDNGSGMDLPTIVNGWLTISNSPKRKMKKDNITTPKYNRIPLGEKGLGRLSVQKLGTKVTMITKSKESNEEITLIIPWKEFTQNTTLDRINLVCEKKKVDDVRSYTKIIITGLINPSFWDTEAVKKDLEKTINQIVSPFRFHDNKFIISAKIGDFKIDVNNSIFNDILKTARAEYVFDITDDNISLKCRYKIDFFKKRNIYLDFDWFDFNKDYFKEMFDLIKSKYPDSTYIENDSIIYEINYIVSMDSIAKLKRNSDGLIYYPGNFDGAIYDFSYDGKYISELVQNYDFVYALKEQEYKEYIKTNKGVKVIRDGFVVQGYGDGAIDWLNISAQVTTQGRYTDLRNENLIGYIKLTGKNNQQLKETTSREGFINDEYYQNFFLILREVVIKRINSVNTVLGNIMKDYLLSISLKEDPVLEVPIENVKGIVEKAQNISSEIKTYTSLSFNEINKKKAEVLEKRKTPNLFNNFDGYNELNEVVKMLESIISEFEKKFDVLINEIECVKKSAVIIEDDFQKFNQRISDVFELAGLGISVELFTHELYTTINNVNEKIKSIKNSSSEMNYITNSMNTLRKQISYFHPGLKYVRMKKETFSISDFIRSHIEFYSHQANSKKVQIVVVGDDKELFINANRGMLNQVLDNLFSNSLYWLIYSRDKIKYIDECKYYISINDNYTIDVWDNGVGISNDIEKELFNPFITHKENGRGLGLFICKHNLENNNATIRLLRERNEFNNLYKFKIDLSNLVRGLE